MNTVKLQKCYTVWVRKTWKLRSIWKHISKYPLRHPRSHQEVWGRDRPRDWDRALQLWTKQTVVYSDSKENTIMLSKVSGCMQKTVCGQEERLLHGLRFHLRGGQGCCSFLSIFILNWGLECLLDISFTVSLKDKLYPFFKSLFLKLHSRKWTPMTFYSVLIVHTSCYCIYIYALLKKKLKEPFLIRE